ncbi:hypothetical protein SAMD00019534_107620 [Acytostelium subglobosum LB1]|uniref:hypothetical protein n=1 Tax=Acytostelium subglobosum LB1 TaxID=1410327 RepID=UPI0006451E98|nr:hypothetical protein SAMD00019534_107620 [Acytostelium subglobosum LB1]GAM27586.1 hypothetical protein SAMD00019534_107620 [Acytostelium subglobosum LB1]|eukprot:XP_012749651.1 hypothetical protein SAMD00019534_107620 [Acytostelium subglobosum LB1]
MSSNTTTTTTTTVDEKKKVVRSIEESFEELNQEETKILNNQCSIIKEINYRLVNSITGAQSIQKEKDAVNVDEPVKGYDHMLRKLARLQHFVSVESKDLVNSIEILESIQIVGSTQKYRQREIDLKMRTESLVALSDAASKCPLHATKECAEQHHQQQQQLREQITSSFNQNELEDDDDDDDDDYTDSSDYTSDEEEEDDDEPRERATVSPRKLREIKLLLLQKIEVLLNYLDNMSADLSALRLRAMEKKQLYGHIPFDLSLNDSFDLQSPEVRRMLAANAEAAAGLLRPPVPVEQTSPVVKTPTKTTTLSVSTNGTHTHFMPTPQPVELRSSGHLPPVITDKLKSMNITSPEQIFRTDDITVSNDNDDPSVDYTNLPTSTPSQLLHDYRQKRQQVNKVE